MSRLSGSKRKTNGVQDEQQEDPYPAVDDHVALTIDSDITREMQTIKDGTHPSLVLSLESLQRANERKVEAADRHRKMQIKNINALYEYEVEDAAALFKRAYAELQSDLTAELTSERKRQQLIQAELIKQKLVKSDEDAVSSTSLGALAGGAGGRSTRSTALADDESTGAAKSKGEVTNSNSAGNAKKKPSSFTTEGLDYALPEHSMRADFLEIVRDLHSRVAAFENSKPDEQRSEQVRLSGDLAELYVGDETYAMGDMVVVFSVLSQENISGILTALSHREMVVRTGSGARFSVLVGQLRSGRVTVSKDKESIDNALIFRAAADMEAVRDKYYK
ncbi:hypothetical protein B484DRAFT_441840 [Ochromonadaceae sp. CCMP2298]|nr:hypothetical protein B484DRAFT_441840 [Ochromonadaceae sp. CCMP2298]|eukprot:CAMPEP_0173327274 /NCGR_PEP_ID=MMETSP1144-20121109/1514_1 /TAXON_ID=483371 /ORGANISM="non described non described, Strain CCMP2298" /LENGTH=334 /DNA_ID=CAMNT_0014271645 /DNA_START=9 /DNA_END=1013 /DNA_ORIENTATION=-